MIKTEKRPTAIDAFFVFLFLMMIGAAICRGASYPVPWPKTGGADARHLCTWDITYYLLGKKQPPEISAHAWWLTERQIIEMIGPFAEGHVFVELGKARFTCDGKDTQIGTLPLPQGSFLLLE